MKGITFKQFWTTISRILFLATFIVCLFNIEGVIMQMISAILIVLLYEISYTVGVIDGVDLPEKEKEEQKDLNKDQL